MAYGKQEKKRRKKKIRKESGRDELMETQRRGVRDTVCENTGQAGTLS